ncbi:hypothetical protein K0M31_010029, partial [Melipona bicolor]
MSRPYLSPSFKDSGRQSQGIVLIHDKGVRLWDALSGLTGRPLSRRGFRPRSASPPTLNLFLRPRILASEARTIRCREAGELRGNDCSTKPEQSRNNGNPYLSLFHNEQ